VLGEHHAKTACECFELVAREVAVSVQVEQIEEVLGVELLALVELMLDVMDVHQGIRECDGLGAVIDTHAGAKEGELVLDEVLWATDEDLIILEQFYE
jgi:hypothetical protein